MVFVALYKQFLAVEHCGLPFGEECRLYDFSFVVEFGVAHSVGFDVCFVNEVYAVPVAKLVPQRRLGIMGGSDSVDIVLLHCADIAHHCFAVYGVTLFWMVFVHIHAVYFDGLAVDHQLCVLYFDFAESDFGRRGLDGLAVGGAQLEYEGVERGVVVVPLVDLGKLRGEYGVVACLLAC